MSEKIELQAEVHSDTGGAGKDSQEEETEIGQKEVVVVSSSEGEKQTNDEKSEPAVEVTVETSESQTAQEKDREDSNGGKEEKAQGDTAKKGVEEGEERGDKKEAKNEEGSPSKAEEVTKTELKEKPQSDDQQPQSNEDVIQQEPEQMATENSKLNGAAAESERVAPVCQVARAQASIQARMRPGMWMPGVRNLHSAREVWVIKATPDECVDKLVAAVDAIPQEELMEISKLDKNRHFVEIFAFTRNCNWLDVVEVTFHTGEEPGTTRGEIVSFSSGLFPAWIPLSFLCNCCCFYFPFSGNGQNMRRIGLIKDALQLDVTVRN